MMDHSVLLQHTHDGPRVVRRGQFFVASVALLAFALFAALAAPPAHAISDSEELTQFGSLGSGAGQLGEDLSDIAADPTTGHVYVTDASNNRIDEFTAWGNFVKAFGWDVAPGAVNEQQEVRVRAASGQFRLTFGTFTTADLPFNAAGSESEGPESVEAALNALPSIGGAGGNVSVSVASGTPDGRTPYVYVVTFKGSLAAANVAQLTIASATTQPAGGVPSTTLEVRTRADGTAGGVGLESCTAESGCKIGLRGAGAGELSLPVGIVVGVGGDVFVRERASPGKGEGGTSFGGNVRVQKFDSAGRFQLMFGGEVNKTKSAEPASTEAERNRCTSAQLNGGDECGVGTEGNGLGQFGAGFSYGIALSATGKIFVPDVERIQRFSAEGEYEGSVAVVGKTVRDLAVAPGSGDFYANVGEPNIRKLDAVTGAEVAQLEGRKRGTGSVATDPAGNVFAVDGITILEFDSSGKPLSPSSCCEAALTLPSGQGTRLESLGTNAAGTLYAIYTFRPADSTHTPTAFIRVFGPGPAAFEAPPKVPPTIVGQFASSVDSSDAELKSEINPHFWSDTRYYVEYGTGKCSEGGCGETAPAAPGPTLGSKMVGTPLQSAGVILEGLDPGTTYHYRFVAQSSGGGPVRGIGGEVGADGGESTFTTYPPAPAPSSDCPNQALRTGFSRQLPDCRAFEMVSPLDKNNGDIQALLDVPGYGTSLSQSALDGSRFTYSSYRAFADPKSALYTNQYLAARDPITGWSTEALAVPGVAEFTTELTDNQYKAFSPDLCSGWLMTRVSEPLAPGATKDSRNLYRNDRCDGGKYESLAQVEVGPQSYPVLEGTSIDGKKALLTSEEKLTEDAAGGGTRQAYLASGGSLKLICHLPNGLPSKGNCSGGTGSPVPLSGPYEQERLNDVRNAISADGSRVYWTDSDAALSGPGKIYLRLNPDQEQSAMSAGECVEAEKACTVPVSGAASSKPARFLGASSDGARALFELTEGAQAGSLYEFELGAGSPTLVAPEGMGVAASSEDLSRIYFVSGAVLPETTGATAGKPNLYLREEGATSFIATLSKEDAHSDPKGVNTGITNTSSQTIFHAARATPSGKHLVFISTASLTGYDNTDLATGNADSEIYRFEAGTKAPVCVSCNPSGARPVGRVIQGSGNSASSLATASSLAMPENALYAPKVISADGSRVFFNSFDALLPRDTNGKEDVYEWEAASGPANCSERGAELFVPSSGGCLSLISSGESPSDSEYLDASEEGGDAFFATSASLLPQDPGLIDIYDARTDGGFPPAAGRPGACEGEACQGPASPPNDPTPASATFRGAGNIKTTGSRCAKGKMRRKGHCVAKKKSKRKPSKDRKKPARGATHTRRNAR